MQFILQLFCILKLINYVASVKANLKYSIGESHVYVFDDLIKPLHGNAFQQYLTTHIKYSYLYPDPYENDSPTPNDGNLHWKAHMSPSQLIKMRIWKPIRNAYKSLPENFVKGRRFLPYEAFGTLLQRGHFTVPFVGDEKNIEDKIFMRIFLTKGLDKHAYSDHAFYSSDDEIVTSIQPKPFRIVVWTGNVSTLMRPPSMGFEQQEFSFILKLSPAEMLFKKSCEDFEKVKEKEKEYMDEPFPLKNHANMIDIKDFDPEEHLLGKYYDRDGNVVAFFDNVLPKHVVDAVRTYYTHYRSGFSGNVYDPGTVESHDNVQWILQLNHDSVLNTPYWSMISKLSEYLSNGTTTSWYPYDVSCNLIQHTHHTRIHLDCVHQEFEYTFLMYLNPNWTEDKYAETAFFQYDEDTIKGDVPIEHLDAEGNLAYDFIAAAIPKYGRVALFRNLIPHSARPPAPNFLAARYTFPVKVSESPAQAKAKMLHEHLDYKRDDTPEDPAYEDLRRANYELFLKKEKRDWVEHHLQLMKNAKQQTEFENKKTLEAILLPEKFRES